MKKFLLAVTVFFLLFLGNVGATYAATYYISPSGSDANPGSNAAPFKTFAKAVKILKAGDTLLAKDGVYTEPLNTANSDLTKRVYFPSGAPGQPITIKSQNRWGAIIRPLSGGNLLNVGNASNPVRYLAIDGFSFDGVNMAESSVLVGVGVYISGKPTDNSWVSNISFTNNEIKNIGKKIDISKIDFNAPRNHPMYSANYGFWSSAMMVKDSTDIVISGNYIHHNGITDFDHGVYQYSKNTVIENNTIYNNSGTCIKGGWDPGDNSSAKSIIRNNLCYNNGYAQFVRGANGTVAGIKPRGLSSHFSVDYEYYNNIVFGKYSAGGIDIIYGPRNTKIYNNFVYNTGGNGIIIGGGTATPGKWDVINTQVKNNIAYSTNATYAAILIASRAKDTVVENNIVAGTNAKVEVKQESNNTIVRNTITQDPRFVSFPTAYLASDKQLNNMTEVNALKQAIDGLRLTSSSPAINKGFAATEVKYDFINVKRPQGAAYDIGAFEFGGTPTTTLPPIISPSNPPSSPGPTATARASVTPEPAASGGSNTIKIINVPLSSTQNGFAIDAIVDNGITRQGESSSAIAYSSGWTTDNNAGYLGGQAKWTRTAGSTATYQTNSPSVQIRTKFESTTGSFDVFVNEAKVGNYKVNSSTTSFDTITINLPAATPVSKLGDANGDSKVDAADFTIWLNEYKSRQGTRSDFNRDGRVDGVDYSLWLTNYGK